MSITKMRRRKQRHGGVPKLNKGTKTTRECKQRKKKPKFARLRFYNKCKIKIGGKML